MITEAKVLMDWKLRNKLNVFHVYYMTKNHVIEKITCSFIRGYDDASIIKEMKDISNSDNFLKWLMPFSDELKKERVTNEVFHTNNR